MANDIVERTAAQIARDVNAGALSAREAADAALAGLDLIRAAYAEAIRQRYRFYSYGDAMLIL